MVIGWQVGGAYLGGAFLPGTIGWVMAHTSLEVLAPALAVAIVAMLGSIAWLDRRTR